MLSAEEFGCHLRLKLALWENNAELPFDPAKLARIAGVSKRKFVTTIWPSIGEKYDIIDEKLVHSGVKHDWESAVGLSAVRAINGRRGGVAKSLKYHDQDLAIAKRLAKQNSGNSPSNKPGKPPGKPPGKNVAHGVADRSKSNITTSETVPRARAKTSSPLLDSLRKREAETTDSDPGTNNPDDDVDEDYLKAAR